MMACNWGLIMSYGVFFDFFNESTTIFSLLQATLRAQLVGGTKSCMVLLLSVIVGHIFDVQKHRWISTIGFVFIALGHFLLEREAVILIWITSGLLASVGIPCLSMHSSHNAIQWLPLNACFATGVTSAGAGFARMTQILKNCFRMRRSP